MLRNLTVPSLPALQRELQELTWFQPHNASASYSLDLATPLGYAIAENLQLSDFWEMEVCRVKHLPDCSQKGTGSMWRNEAYCGAPFAHGPDWVLPEDGELRLDYQSVATRYIPMPALPDGEPFLHLAACLQAAPVPEATKLRVFRYVSVRWTLTVEQVQRLLDLFPEDREAFFATVRPRIRDVDKLDVRDLFAKSLPRIYRLVGILNLMNPLRLDNQHFELRLDVFEERQVVQLLVRMAAKETGVPFIETRLNREQFFVPASWMDKVPSQGLFETGYFTDEKHRVESVRLEFAKRYLGWGRT
jgi:hypothetical protein